MGRRILRRIAFVCKGGFNDNEKRADKFALFLFLKYLFGNPYQFFTTTSFLVWLTNRSICKLLFL